ncbi:hypothetical protein DBV15_05173 [Temnothorax longispinosus]|uniref:Uncharacterized protein n=1 Tax=Temnothorax longispinosus TaxID=300112 RepID=A0A4S2KS87_9HYME|nr:hypothetical protein DBV15_05173 [Temnothorax longispinosus]
MLRDTAHDNIQYEVANQEKDLTVLYCMKSNIDGQHKCYNCDFYIYFMYISNNLADSKASDGTRQSLNGCSTESMSFHRIPVDVDIDRRFSGITSVLFRGVSTGFSLGRSVRSGGQAVRRLM